MRSGIWSSTIGSSSAILKPLIRFLSSWTNPNVLHRNRMPCWKALPPNKMVFQSRWTPDMSSRANAWWRWKARQHSWWKLWFFQFQAALSTHTHTSIAAKWMVGAYTDARSIDRLCGCFEVWVLGWSIYDVFVSSWYLIVTNATYAPTFLHLYKISSVSRSPQAPWNTRWQKVPRIFVSSNWIKQISSYRRSSHLGCAEEMEKMILCSIYIYKLYYMSF